MKKKGLIAVLSAMAITAALSIGAPPAPAHAAAPPNAESGCPSGQPTKVHLTGKLHANRSAEIQLTFSNGASCLVPAIWK